MESHALIRALFGILLIAALIVSTRMPIIKKPMHRTLAHIVLGTLVFLVALSVILFPGLSPVKTTGAYAYASQTIELTQGTRPDPFSQDGSPRKLSVLVYYPTQDKLEDGSCPLIVFSHGGISFASSNTSLYQELASHGYVVASISHTYHALQTRIEGKTIWIDAGHLTELQTENSDQDINASYTLFQEWMELRMEDIQFVISSLTDQITMPFSFSGLIDTERIGVAGHSLGGSAALGVARQNEKVRAVAALESPYMHDMVGVDGTEFVWNTAPYTSAMLNIYSDNGYPLVMSDHEYVQNKTYLYNDDRVEYLYIEGSNHYTLTDLVRTSPLLCALLGKGYHRPGYETLALINETCLAFFNRHLQSESALTR